MRVPRVSVLMAVFNGERTLAEAVVSVLDQSFADLELLVVDDGSTDWTLQLLKEFRDPRLRLVAGERNLGLSAALNKGLQMIRGEFIARMDADDVSLPARFTKQVEYLDRHPNVGVVGAFVETFSDAGVGEPRADPNLVRYPTEMDSVGAAMLFRSVLAHPAVMLRRELFTRHALAYESTFRYAQDYALWLECLRHGIGLANVDEVLLRYRVHDGQLSTANEKMQAEGTVIRSRFLRWFVEGVTPEELLLHDAVSRDFWCQDAAWLQSAAAWLEKLATINEARHVFGSEAFLRALTGRYVALCRFAREKGMPAPAAGAFQPFIRAGSL